MEREKVALSLQLHETENQVVALRAGLTRAEREFEMERERLSQQNVEMQAVSDKEKVDKGMILFF